MNHSRVAAQTGLTRADVKRLLRHNVFTSAHRSQTPVERVIDGWRSDREFATRPGHPKRLQISGLRGSFARLVRKYGGDVPHRAVLDELRRIGAVIDAEGSVHLQVSPHFRQRHDFAFLSPVIQCETYRFQHLLKKSGPNTASFTPFNLPPWQTLIYLGIILDPFVSLRKINA